MLAKAVLHIQNISAHRQDDTIVPLFIRGKSPNFVLPVLAEDDQGVFRKRFVNDSGGMSIRKRNRCWGNNSQTSFQGTRWRNCIRCRTSGRETNEGGGDQVLQQ